MGTTSSGAIDRIDEICDISKCTCSIVPVKTESQILIIGELARLHPEIFIHVDAAWAGMCGFEFFSIISYMMETYMQRSVFALPEHRTLLRLDDINRRGQEYESDTVGEVHSFCTNLHKAGVSMPHIHERYLKLP